MKSQKNVWNNIAKKWNCFRETPSPSVIEFMKDKTGNILDLGCGSGRNFKAINKNSRVYALDFSKEMLKFAEGKAKELNLNIETKESETDSLSYEDNFFNTSICVAVLHCINSKEKRKNTIKEIFRTLKKEGCAFISVWGKNSPRLRNKSKECFVPWTVKSDKDFRKEEGDIKEERYTYVYDLEELKDEILEAGFEIDRIWEERNINVICRKR